MAAVFGVEAEREKEREVSCHNDRRGLQEERPEEMVEVVSFKYQLRESDK